MLFSFSSGAEGHSSFRLPHHPSRTWLAIQKWHFPNFVLLCPHCSGQTARLPTFLCNRSTLEYEGFQMDARKPVQEKKKEKLQSSDHFS